MFIKAVKFGSMHTNICSGGNGSAPLGGGEPLTREGVRWLTLNFLNLLFFCLLNEFKLMFFCLHKVLVVYS